MTAIIIEDEIPAGLHLKKILGLKNIEVLEIIKSVKNAIKWLNTNQHPDIVFSDIKLNDGYCFQIFESINLKSKIVFTTAFNEFALDAFNYNSIDYLLKPIDESKLDKLLAKIQFLQIGFQNELKWGDFNNLSYKSSYIISIGTSLKKIITDEILFFYSENNSTYIYNNLSRSYLINKSLDKIETELNPELFFRISRKYLVNKYYILNIINHNEIELNYSNQYSFKLQISKLRYKTFLEWFAK
jgi:DNA-binding LytR/AlgR family response regulator